MLTNKFSRKLSTGKHSFDCKFTQCLRSLQPCQQLRNTAVVQCVFVAIVHRAAAHEQNVDNQYAYPCFHIMCLCCRQR